MKLLLLLSFRSLVSFSPTHSLSSAHYFCSYVTLSPMSSSYYFLITLFSSLNLDSTNNCNRSGVLLALALKPRLTLPALYSKCLLWMISSICLFFFLSLISVLVWPPGVIVLEAWRGVGQERVVSWLLRADLYSDVDSASHWFLYTPAEFMNAPREIMNITLSLALFIEVKREARCMLYRVCVEIDGGCIEVSRRFNGKWIYMTLCVWERKYYKPCAFMFMR